MAEIRKIEIDSECGYIPPDDNDDIFYSNFCPNCGAKMDEVTK